MPSPVMSSGSSGYDYEIDGLIGGGSVDKRIEILQKVLESQDDFNRHDELCIPHYQLFFHLWIFVAALFLQHTAPEP